MKGGLVRNLEAGTDSETVEERCVVLLSAPPGLLNLLSYRSLPPDSPAQKWDCPQEVGAFLVNQ